jgi:hypothetical protein
MVIVLLFRLNVTSKQGKNKLFVFLAPAVIQLSFENGNMSFFETFFFNIVHIYLYITFVHVLNTWLDKFVLIYSIPYITLKFNYQWILLINVLTRKFDARMDSLFHTSYIQHLVHGPVMYINDVVKYSLSGILYIT